MKLGGVDEGALNAIAELRLGPEEAGLRLRDRVESASRPPLRRLEQAARRRFRARGEDDAGLAAFDAWFPDLALTALRDPTLDPVALVDGSVLAEARRPLDGTPRMPAELDLLRACLPALTGEASLTALRGGGLLNEAGGRTSVRLLGLIATSIADQVRDDPLVLRRCLVERQGALLRAVYATSSGPKALVSGLERLDAPSLALALGALGADWLRGLPWTERLAAWMVAIAEVAGTGFGSMMIARSARRPPISPTTRTTRSGLPSTCASTASAVATPSGWPIRPQIHLTTSSPAVGRSPSSHFSQVRPRMRKTSRCLNPSRSREPRTWVCSVISIAVAARRAPSGTSSVCIQTWASGARAGSRRAGRAPETDTIDPDAFREAVREAWRAQPLEERRQALSRAVEKVKLSPGGLEIVCRADGYHGHDPFGPPEVPGLINRAWVDCAAVSPPRTSLSPGTSPSQ